MNDLAKLVTGIRGLTKAEADELVGMLDESRVSDRRPAGDQDGDIKSELATLSQDDWLIAEAISLKAEAAALSRSLDETLDYVRSRCRAIVEVP